MNETVISAAPLLARPGVFLRAGVADWRTSVSPAWALFVADLRGRHRRAWLSYAWLVLPATVTALLCTLIQSQRILTAAPAELPYPLFVLSGMVLWQSFLDALNAPLDHLSRSRQTITRSALPHEVVLGAALCSTGLNIAVRTAVLGAALLVFRAPLASSAFLFVAGVAALFILGFSIGLLAAPFGLLYDDVGRALMLGATMLFFLTPVVYSLPRASPWSWNPVGVLLDTSRGWLTGSSAGSGTLAVTVIAAIALPLTWLFYRVARPHVVARLA